MFSRHCQNNLSGSSAVADFSSRTGAESTVHPVLVQNRVNSTSKTGFRRGMNVVAAVLLVGFCAFRIAGSDTSVSVANAGAAGAWGSHDIAKADFIDDIIDVLTGGTKPPPPPPTDS